MISYELAKELKEAGFPRMWELKTGDMLVDREGTHVSVRNVSGKELYAIGEYPWFRIPTLSELITACGEYFGRLEAPWDGCQYWVAVWHKGKGNRFYTKGNTPEEAVTQLWLAIKEKGFS